jgi:RNA polymerase-binding transcription factor DksA
MTNRIAERPTGLGVVAGYEPPFLELRERLEQLWRHQVDEVTEWTIRLHDTRAALGQVPADHARVAAELATIEAHLEAARREFVELDGALARFAKGSYGFCGHCGDSVAANRLASLPSARLCASCQFWSRTQATGG